MKHKFWFITLLLFIGFSAPAFYAQPHFTCTVINDTLKAPNVYEFDIYMRSDTTTTLELAGVNFGFLYNPAVQDTGIITVSWVPNSSELTNPAQLPKNFRAAIATKDSAEVGIIIVGPRLPVGYGNGSIISNIGLGTRIGRLRLTNNINFQPERMNIEWSFYKKNGLYPVTITLYINKLNTGATTFGKYESKLVNPVLK
jgi:hypothetical protein